METTAALVDRLVSVARGLDYEDEAVLAIDSKPTRKAWMARDVLLVERVGGQVIIGWAERRCPPADAELAAIMAPVRDRLVVREIGMFDDIRSTLTNAVRQALGEPLLGQ